MIGTILIVISSLYGIWLILKWMDLQEFLSAHEMESVRTNGVWGLLVCFRNEESRIEQLLQSMVSISANSTISKIVFVNDHSADGSVTLINEVMSISQIPYEILDLKDGVKGKKAALKHAFQSYPELSFLLCDADCSFPSDWSKDMINSVNAQDLDLCAGLVRMSGGPSFLHLLQRVDWYAQSFIWISALVQSRPFLMSSANTALNSRNIDLRNMDLKEEFPSGDDIQILNAFKKEKLKIGISPFGIVETKAESSWKELWSQRMRWAGKLHIYRDSTTLGTFLIIGLGLVTWIISVVLFLSGVIGSFTFWSILIIRFVPDYMAVRSISVLVKDNLRIHHIILIWLFYPFFIILIQLFAMAKKFSWKGRDYS